MLLGHVDQIANHVVTGWAADVRTPNREVDVVIFVNDQEVGRVTANEPRPDLAVQQVYGDGQHGFSFRFPRPLSVLRTHRVMVRFAENREVIEGGRATLSPHQVDQPATLTPLCVTATGRSGTTMMMRRLGEHPSVVIGELFPFEMKLLGYFAQAFEVMTSPGDWERSVHYDKIQDDVYRLGFNPFFHPDFVGMFRDPDRYQDFFATTSPTILADAFKRMIDAFYREAAATQDKRGISFFAEKCDCFYSARDFARAAFPRVKEIVLVRDPRDLACSYRSFWSSPGDVSFQILRSMRDRMLEIHDEQPADAIFVRYEDMILKPEQTQQQIADLLGAEAPVDIDLLAEEENFKRHGTSTSPSASIGRWRRELPIDAVERFTREFDRYLEVFGYLDDDH